MQVNFLCMMPSEGTTGTGNNVVVTVRVAYIYDDCWVQVFWLSWRLESPSVFS